MKGGSEKIVSIGGAAGMVRDHCKYDTNLSIAAFTSAPPPMPNQTSEPPFMSSPFDRVLKCKAD
jgi:hypothetical protein